MKFITDALDIEWNNYGKNLHAFQEKTSANNVHDLRVSIRRLMASIDLIERFTPDNSLLRARAILKEQLSMLSELRDVHVEILAARRFLKELPELKEFHDTLLDRESCHLSAAKKELSNVDKKFVENAINRVRIRFSTTRATTNAAASNKIIEAAIDSSFDVVNKKLEFVNLADHSTIHNVRLAFRPLRYMIEMLQPLIPRDRKQLGTARFLARLMGEIQDLEVLMKDLVEFKWKKESAQRAVIEIWLDLERQEAETAQRFLRAIPKFGNVWKPVIHEQGVIRTIDEKILYVLRHGIAVKRANAIYPLDSDRPLTPKGVKKIRRIASGMRRLNVDFDVILTSPYRRALETAFLVGREYGLGEAIQSMPALKPEVLPEELIRVLQDRYASCRNLLLVGHEPQLSALISTLTSGSAGVRPVLKKGGLCKLQVDKLVAGKCATLLWLLTPRQLGNIA